MSAAVRFVKKEPVLTAAGLLAVLSAVLVPPDAGYAGYVNWSVLALLYCLMTVVAGLRRCGAFDVLTHALAGLTRSTAALTALLTALCFFGAAVITNDVALLTFVPFTIGLFGTGRTKRLVYVLTLETVAANLGSMVTPIGNPQNLYLYARYAMTGGTFFRVMLPLGAVSLLAVAALAALAPRERLEKDGKTARPALCGRLLALYGGLFLLCLLCVVKVLPWYVLLPLVCAAEAVFDRPALWEADFSLLATFLFFFVFVGNAVRLDAVCSAVQRLLAGREVTASALVSQVISNVPAAAMLSAFTDNGTALLWGTNIGGLGTPVASMASLITLRLYAGCGAGQMRRYLGVFSAVNFGLLAAFLLAAPLLERLI